MRPLIWGAYIDLIDIAGGVATHTTYLAKALSKHIQTTILTPSLEKKILKTDNLKVVGLGRTKKVSLWYNLYTLKMKDTIDLIHTLKMFEVK